MSELFASEELETLIVIARALSLLVCEKNRAKGLELLDRLNELEDIEEEEDE